MFTAIESQKISQIVVEQIQNMIMSGQLKAGDKLPPEREMTEIFKIGRPALREALKALEVLGLVECRHGLGNYIVNNVEINFFKPLSLAFKLQNGKLHEILQLRLLVESFAVEEAAKSASEQDIKNLEAILASMKRAPDFGDKSTFDQSFHYELVRICANSLILNTYENVSYLLDHFIDQAVKISSMDDDSIEKIYDEHEKILAAIRNRDAKSAVDSLQYHLGRIREALMHEL